MIDYAAKEDYYPYQHKEFYIRNSPGKRVAGSKKA